MAPVLHYHSTQPVTARAASYGVHASWPRGDPQAPRVHLGPGPVLPSHAIHPLPGPFRGWVLDLRAREWIIFCGLPANDNT